MKNNSKNQSGVTLIESLVAMSIVVVGLVAIISLALVSLDRARISKEQIVATTLVREGIEIVRTVRDTGWLDNVDCWTETDASGDFAACGLKNGIYAVDYGDASDLSVATRIADVDESTYFSEYGLFDNDSFILKKDINGFYNHDTGDETRYRRVVQITDIDPETYEAKRIRAKVSWEDRGRFFSVESETVLSNWR